MNIIVKKQIHLRNICKNIVIETLTTIMLVLLLPYKSDTKAIDSSVYIKKFSACFLQHVERYCQHNLVINRESNSVNCASCRHIIFQNAIAITIARDIIRYDYYDY